MGRLGALTPRHMSTEKADEQGKGTGHGEGGCSGAQVGEAAWRKGL